MCYTTTTHFNRCSHRTSTITFCPRGIQHRPTIYHPPARHARPCKTNGHEGDIFVQRDGLCRECSKASFWSAGGSGGRVEDHTGRDGPRRKKDKFPSAAARMAGAIPPHHHPHATRRRAAPPGPAESAYPVPTGAAGGRDRCPLSEAFERVVTIDGHDDGGGAQVEGSRWVSGGIGEGGGGTRRRQGEYGPFRPPRFASGAGKEGIPSWSGGHGGYAGRKATRRPEKKHVRFAPKVEVLYFKRDWATRTLRGLSREYKGRR